MRVGFSFLVGRRLGPAVRWRRSAGTGMPNPYSFPVQPPPPHAGAPVRAPVPAPQASSSSEDMDDLLPADESMDDELRQIEATAAAAVATPPAREGGGLASKSSTPSAGLPPKASSVDASSSLEPPGDSTAAGRGPASAGADAGDWRRQAIYDPVRFSPFGMHVAQLADAERWDELRKYLGEQYPLGNDLSVLLYVRIISTLGRAGQLQMMMDYLHEMRTRGLLNVLVFNLAIGACARAHHPDVAFDLYLAMQRFDLQPNQFTYGHLLQACSAVNDLNRARETLVEMRARGLAPSDFVGLELLRCCNSPREIDEMLAMLEAFTPDFVAHSTRTMNNAVTRCLYLGEVNAALILYRTLVASGTQPNSYSLQQLIRSCMQSSMFDEAVELFEEAKARSLEINRNTYVYMLRIFRDARRTDFAIALLREVLELGHPVMIRAWDIALVALCEQGKMVAARIVWDLLRKNMAAVPRSTVETYVRACQVSGLTTQAAEASALIPH
jgi:pentatricopeptide repeat protein